MEKITNSPKRTARWWNWTSDENNERILRIEGTIAENSWVDDEITPKQFKAELMSGSGDITVFINSVGGDVIAAAQIYNMLMEYKGNVTVKIDMESMNSLSRKQWRMGLIRSSPVIMELQLRQRQ